MNKANDFEKFGKNIHYPVPEGFFDEITNSTLEKAKKRERQLKSRKLIFAWSAAASVLLIVSIGIFLSNHSQLVVPSTLTTVEPAKTINIYDSVRSEANGYQAIQKSSDTKLNADPVRINSSETLDDLLAEMDEEELQQMAELLSGELFIDELTND